MAKKTLLFILALLLVKPISMKAQSDFFVNVYCNSANIWSATYLQMPTNFINGMIQAFTDEDYEDGALYGGRYLYDSFSIRDSGEKVKLKSGSMWGFKATDMFRNFEYGLRAGWQPQLSPFGFFVSCGYNYRQFRANLVEGEDVLTKYKLSILRPGVGIRVTPFINMLEDENWSPIFEIGTYYNYLLGTKGAFENDKEQFNNGMTSNFAIGIRTPNVSVTLGTEIDHFNLFNQDYVINGEQPYKDIKTRHFNIYLSASHDF